MEVEVVVGQRLTEPGLKVEAAGHHLAHGLVDVHDDELVDTEPGHQISGFAQQFLSDGLQEPVPSAVTQAVVDHLQVVEIDEADRHGGIGR